MRASRLLTILFRLQAQRRVTAVALARELEVSIRTVYRDVDELSAAGVPVRAERGPRGGFELLEGFETRLTGLTVGEAEALLLGGLAGPAAELGLGAARAGVRAKLLAAAPPAARRAASRVADRVVLDPHPWYTVPQPPPHLRAIAAAVWNDERIVIRYESWKATVRRRLDPLGLVVKAGAWYLVARAAGGALRTYKIANVLSVRRLAEPFPYPAGFDLARHWREDVRRFTAGLQTGEAVLRVAPAALSRIERLGTAAAAPILAAPPDAGGWRRARVPIESVAHAAAELLAFADAVEVLAPAALRRALRARALRTAALYAPMKRA